MKRQSGSNDRRRVKRFASAMLVLVGLCGCGAGETVLSGGAGGTSTTSNSGGSGTGATSGGEAPVLPQGTSLFIEVKDRSGMPIPQAWVLMVEGQEVVLDTHTDELGQLLLENLDPGRVVAQVRAPGFTEGAAVAQLESGMHGGAVVVLSPLGVPLPIEADADSTVQKDGISVTIPANSLVDELGELVTGSAEVTIVPIDPTNGGLGAMPGPLEAITEVGGEVVNLETVFMADVTLSKDGKRLQLADGATATLQLPVPDALAVNYMPGAVIDAWSFNVASGLWQKEGYGVVEISQEDPSKLVWTAQVGHFTLWNVDHAWFEKHCFAVTVLDSNNIPVANQPVTGAGVSYSGVNQPKFTNASGNVCVELMAGSTANIYLGQGASGKYVTVNSSIAISDCSGISGNACEPITIQTASNAVNCAPGSTLQCPYTGPAGTENVGICKAGIQYCKADGTSYGPCSGQVTPLPEGCGNQLDDNCNNVVNDNCLPPCGIGQSKACYSGPAGTLGVGICKGGTQKCIAIPNSTVWGPCVGEIVPNNLELCDSNHPQDDDCDGTTSECGCGGQVVGATQPCYTGLFGTEGVGICHAGTKTCQQIFAPGGGSQWGACFGQQIPMPGEICATPDDDNCNGTINEVCFCTVPADCGPNTECATWTCSAMNQCEQQFVTSGTALASQTPGDCKTEVCDGSGKTTSAVNPNDYPIDGNECTKDTCTGGVPANAAEAAGTVCMQAPGNKMCDGAGICVECLAGGDCASTICAPTHMCQAATCMDNVKNGAETDKDCGGMDCPPCPDNGACVADNDCQSAVCAANTCAVPTCNDTKKNGAETDKDCGGGACPTCANGKMCIVSGDCFSNICQGVMCVPASCADGTQNNGETDIDCGSAGCQPCVAGKNCTINANCASGVCLANLKCQ